MRIADFPLLEPNAKLFVGWDHLRTMPPNFLFLPLYTELIFHLHAVTLKPLCFNPPSPPPLRELGRKDPRDLSQDTSGTRCFASFLVELSQLVPAAVLPSISVLMPHLSGEVCTTKHYTFRLHLPERE